MKQSFSAGRSVLQDWTNDLSFMMQSVLICATRGPDGIRKDHPVKVLIRYLRRSFLICAFDGKTRWSPYEPGGGSFTGPLKLEGTAPNEGHLDKFVEVYLRHVDELPHHFQLHLMHAAEILGYKHPDSDVRGFWYAFYAAIVNDAHLRMETVEQMDKRLGDNEANWRAAEAGVTALGTIEEPARSVSAIVDDSFKARTARALIKIRHDAENSTRDHHEGIGMLRSWLRVLHMSLFFEGDLQYASQDEIADQLGENPRGHAREFKVK